MSRDELSSDAVSPDQSDSGSGRFAAWRHWLIGELSPYVVSMLFHTLLILFVAAFVGGKAVQQWVGEAPSFVEVDAEEVLPDDEVEVFPRGDAPLDPTELLLDRAPISMTPVADVGDVGDVGTPAGEPTRFVGDPSGLGILLAGGSGPLSLRGFGGASRTGSVFGSASGGRGDHGDGSSYSRRTGPHRIREGATKQSERTVAAALNWLARHQQPDGTWPLNHVGRCKDGTCTDPGTANSDVAGTSLGVLPFLAAGQTHLTKGPYQRTVAQALRALVYNQKPNGDLSAGKGSMYAHGLATIALCEAYGMSRDREIGQAAQAALNFIQTGQDPQTGGWWYEHGQRGGDTSVFGWQVMALKSGQMAYLGVHSQSLERAKTWLASVAPSPSQGQFAYTPRTGPSDTMTAVGLLTSQYLGAGRDDPALQAGVRYLLAHPPESTNNFYYWYYATQVLHNLPGPEWDTWNRAMRRKLIASQCQGGCCEGSWAPTAAGHVHAGGRLMATSLGALTLEVYYRYLPLYQVDRGSE